MRILVSHMKKDADGCRLSKFGWGHSFYELNQSLLEQYKVCKNAADVREAVVRIEQQSADEKLSRRARGEP